MRITIIHNRGSGEGALDAGALIAMVRDAGHHVSYASIDDEAAVHAHLGESLDLVVVVGGDGTMRNVATRMAGRETPLTLIPSGTANNIGRTLGITGEAADLIAGWPGGTVIPFDTCVVRGAAGAYPVVEGMGFGPLAVTIAALSPLTPAEASAAVTSDQVRRDLKVLREVLADYPVHPCEVNLDGRDLSGEFVLVEAMNIRSVGPNVELAPAASVSDGLFDLVLIGADDRPALRDYLTARIDGRPAVLRVPTWRGQHVQLSWKGSRVHIDDQVWPNERDASNSVKWSAGGRVTIELFVNPGALRVLVPRT